MPFVFLLLGVLFLVTAIRGTDGAMFTLVKSEFWGSNSFVPWAAAILILGAIGYAKPIKPMADAMIGLVILAMVLANKGGFFSALNAGLKNPVAPAVDATTTSATGYTAAGAALAAGTTLQPATANADAAAAAGQPNATPAPAQPASPYSPAATTLMNWWSNIFGSSPAY